MSVATNVTDIQEMIGCSRRRKPVNSQRPSFSGLPNCRSNNRMIHLR